MNRKWLFGGVIAALALLSLYFIVKQQLEYAVLVMCVLFAFTNGARAKTFKEKGYHKESKIMRGVSIFFVAAFVVLLIQSII